MTPSEHESLDPVILTAAAPPSAVADDQQRPVVVFDFDGVLTAYDSSTALVRHRLDRSRWMSVPVLATVVGASPLLLSRRTRTTWLRATFSAGALGLDDETYAALVDATVDRLIATGAARDGALASVRAHAEAGARVIVVTAAEQRLARSYLDAVGLGDVEMIGSSVQHRGGIALWEHHNHGHAKVHALEAAGIDRWDVAYTDAASDLPLLARADRPVLVDASAGLEARVAEHLGRPVEVVRWGRPVPVAV